MKSKTWKKISLLALNFLIIATPMAALAQLTNKTVGGVLDFLTSLIQKSVFPLLIAIAMIVFIWGVINYITSAGDSAKRTEAIQYMIWGIVGLFVIVAFWGLLTILANTFGITIGIPKLLEQ